MEGGYNNSVITDEMNFILCVLLVYNDNGFVQTLCITRCCSGALCTKCLHRPIVIINQQYTKDEIHFIYLHSVYVFGLCFINRSLWKRCIYFESPMVCTVKIPGKIILYDNNLVIINTKTISIFHGVKYSLTMILVFKQIYFLRKTMNDRYYTSLEMQMTSVIRTA